MWILSKAIIAAAFSAFLWDFPYEMAFNSSLIYSLQRNLFESPCSFDNSMILYTGRLRPFSWHHSWSDDFALNLWGFFRIIFASSSQYLSNHKLISSIELKHLYKELEDIWNYRSQLSQQMKRNICPPNADIFNTPIDYILSVLVHLMNISKTHKIVILFQFYQYQLVLLIMQHQLLIINHFLL